MQKNTLFTSLSFLLKVQFVRQITQNCSATAHGHPAYVLSPLLHEIFTAFGVHADAHRVAGWRGGVVENLPHLVKQFDA